VKWPTAEARRGVMPRPETVELTPEEQGWLDQIDFDAPYTHDQEAAAKLAKSLLGRNAIPDARLQWVNDPDLNINSKTKSIMEQVFYDNGTTGDRLLTDGNFLPYLHYFIFGPDLPEDVIDQFCSEVDRQPQRDGHPHVTGSIKDRLVKIAKDGTRRHGLFGFEKAEEFWKLAIECGINKMHARMIRDAVVKMRSR
jgi:hypothetical protein